MLIDLLVVICVTLTIVHGNTAIPFRSKLLTTKDGFSFRTKYADDFRLSDRQEEIDDFASRLENARNPDKHIDSESSIRITRTQ